MGYWDHQNKLFFDIIINKLKEEKEIPFDILVATLAVESGKTEDNIVSKLKLLKTAKKISYKKQGDKVLICPFQPKNMTSTDDI